MTGRQESKTNIALAIEALGVKHGGAATVLADLLTAAALDDRISRVHVFCSPLALRLFEAHKSPKIHWIEQGRAEQNKLFRLWWLENRLPGELAHLNSNALICLSGAGMGGSEVPHLTMIQQSLPFSAEAMNLMSATERMRLRIIKWAMSRSCRRSYRVIVQTNTMKKIVEDHFGISSARIQVATPAARPLPTAFSESPALRSMREKQAGLRLLYVGNASRYKNLAVLFEAMKLLSISRPAASLSLTIPASSCPPATGIVPLGYLTESEIAEAYSLADMVVLPSLQETVGLPLLEAMSLGKPVLAADRPYAREICDDAATLFDPRSPAALAAAIENLIDDAPRRIFMASRGREVSIRWGKAEPARAIVDLAFRAIEDRSLQIANQKLRSTYG